MHPQQQTTDRERPTSDQETFCSLVYLIIHNKLLLFELSVNFYQSNKHYPNSLEREVLSFRALLIFEFNRLMHFTSKNSQKNILSMLLHFSINMLKLKLLFRTRLAREIFCLLLIFSIFFRGVVGRGKGL